MNTSLRNLLTDEVRDLPTAPIPVEAVVSSGRRRLWRHRAAGGTASVAAVAALALVAPSFVDLPGSGGESVVAGGVDREAALYSTGSTIHYGDREIDVSPQVIYSFVRTDDGFVFVNQDSDVYFADGASVERIGGRVGSDRLAADDTGSYVGWVDYGTIPDRPEYVVYDTSTRSEVLRGIDEDGEPSGGGEHTTDVVDIDGDVVYLRDSKGFVSRDLTDGTSRRIASTLDPGWLWGVADGRIAHVEWDDGRRYLVVGEDPQADRPRVPIGRFEYAGAELSPSGKHVVTLAPLSGRRQLVVTEMPSRRDVTPDGLRYIPGLAPLGWVGDDSFYIAWKPRGAEKVDVSRCWISTGECQVVAEAVARSYDLRGPNGDSA